MITLPDPGAPNLEFERPADRAHLERTAAALANGGFKAQIADSPEHARPLVLEAMPEGSEVHSALSRRARYAPAAPALAITMMVGTGPFGHRPAGTAMLLIPDRRRGPISQTVEQELPQLVGEK